MNEKTKNWLGGAGIVVLISLAWSALSAARSYSASIEPSSFRSFSVQGEGEVATVADVATISFSVTTEGGNDVGPLQAKNTEAMNAIIAFLRGQGVANEDVKTATYSINPRMQYFDCSSRLLQDNIVRPCPPSEVVGYTISQTVAVKIRDFESIGTILAGVAERGATGVSNLHFTVDDPTEVESEARAKAIKQAEIKARAIAKAAGFRLGRILSIDEGGFDYPRAYATDTSYLKMEVAGAGAPTIEPGSEEIKIRITVRYEIR